MTRYGLPATKKYMEASLRSTPRDRLPNLFFIQHLLPDTLTFLEMLVGFGVPIGQIVGIPYSSRGEIVARLSATGLPVKVPRAADFERDVRHLLESQIQHGVGDGFRQTVVQEVGGYSSDLVSLAGTQLRGRLGIVEETKYGLWRYESCRPLAIAVVQLADSDLKRIEGFFVGRAVVRALEAELAHTESSLELMCCGVLGFGDIGASVAENLRSRCREVAVYDTNEIRRIDAKARGFRSIDRPELLACSDVIIGASGTQSLQDDDLTNLRDGVFLCSASSRDIELPLSAIRNRAGSVREVSPSITEYVLAGDATLRILGDGFPLNLRSASLPPALSDLLFCQVWAGILKSVMEDLPAGIHGISEEDQRLIANVWWEQYGNMEII